MAGIGASIRVKITNSWHAPSTPLRDGVLHVSVGVLSDGPRHGKRVSLANKIMIIRRLHFA